MTFDCDVKRFPENLIAVKQGMGSEVREVMRGAEDVFVDHVWGDRDLRKAFREAGLIVKRFEQPLAYGEGWISETKVPPWMVYLLEVRK